MTNSRTLALTIASVATAAAALGTATVVAPTAQAHTSTDIRSYCGHDWNGHFNLLHGTIYYKGKRAVAGHYHWIKRGSTTTSTYACPKH